MSTVYEHTIKLQDHLDASPNPTTDLCKFAQAYIGVVNHRWDPLSKRIAHASRAFFIDDQLTTDSFIYPSQKFGEVILKGYVPRISCIDVSDRLIVALPFFDAVVLGPVQDIEPELVDFELEGYSTVLPMGTPLERPLFVPIEDISFVTFAA